jgi:hypothetical protein
MAFSKQSGISVYLSLIWVYILMNMSMFIWDELKDLKQLVIIDKY